MFDGRIKAVYVDGALDLSQAVAVKDDGGAEMSAAAEVSLVGSAKGLIERYVGVAAEDGAVSAGAMDGLVGGGGASSTLAVERKAPAPSFSSDFVIVKKEDIKQVLASNIEDCVFSC